MHRIDGPGATIDGMFTDGNPLTGTPATVVLAKWLNNLQEEVARVIEAAGGTLDQNSNDQLRAAIAAMIAGGGVTITASAVPIADAGNYYTGTNVEAALQEIGSSIASSLVQATRIRRTVVALSGASHTLAFAHYEGLVEITHTSDAQFTIPPDSTLNAPVGTTLTIFQAGAGKVEALAGAGVTLRVPAGFLAKTYSQHSALVLAKVAANTWRVGGTLEAAP